MHSYYRYKDQLLNMKKTICNQTGAMINLVDKVHSKLRETSINYYISAQMHLQKLHVKLSFESGCLYLVSSSAQHLELDQPGFHKITM